MLYNQIQRKGKFIESCESSTTSNEMVRQIIKQGKREEKRKTNFFWYDSAINIHVFMLGN
jgi:hypothetical protein